MARNTFNSPFGVAVFPWLTKADTRFNSDGVYHTKLRMDPSLDKVASFISSLDQIAEEAKADLPKKKAAEFHMPYETEYDADDNDTGMLLVKFSTYATGKDRKTGETYEKKVTIRNRFDEAVTEPVFGGSLLGITYTPHVYDQGKNTGLKLYLNFVMVKELVTGGGGSATGYGWDVDEREVEEVEEYQGGDGNPDF